MKFELNHQEGRAKESELTDLNTKATTLKHVFRTDRFSPFTHDCGDSELGI